MDRKTNHCIYNINYHIVFCPKYRHKVIRDQIEDAVKQTVQEICDTYGYSLIQMEVMPDHLHIFLSAPPTIAPTEIVRKIKSITANKVFATFPRLKKKYFWGSGYGAEVTILALLETLAPKLSANISKPRSLRKGGENP
jgi:putative transposase